jgi:A/G-specific adenine glycosylase
MLTGAALSRFRRKLLGWFAHAQRDLPWRRTKDPYRVWLSEIMLQQTRVKAVIPYYENFVKHFPNVRALAEAPQEEVLRRWAGLGYYSRAKNLQKAAQEIVAKHASRFPDTREEALELPGIGGYTAAAILSIAYQKELAVLDGNVARVLARLGAVTGDLRNGNRWKNLQATADRLLAAHAPGDWNQAMMELGATICTPRLPQCLLCPVSELCQARKLGLSEVIPEKRKKRANEEITLAALVLTDSAGRTLLLPPPTANAALTAASDVTVLLSRLWHFPTIAVESDAEAEVRSFAAKLLGQRVHGKFVLLGKVRHAVTYRQITLHPFLWEVRKLPACANAKAVALTGISSLPISNLTRKVAHAALTNTRGPATQQVETLRLAGLPRAGSDDSWLK